MKILVISGTHGNETHAVDVVYELSKLKLNLENTEVEFVHAWNKTGLKYNVREFVDESEGRETNDLNRSFPTNGCWNKDALIEDIKLKIQDADVVIDVHNSPLCANSALIDNGPYARSYVDFCKAHNCQYIVRESAGDTIKNYAIENGKVGFTIEIGDMGISDKDNYDVVWLTKLIGDIAADDSYPFHNQGEPFLQSELYTVLYTHFDGLIRGPYLKRLLRNEMIKDYQKGDVMFNIVDPENNSLLETIKAPCDCTLVDFEDNVWATKGGTIGSIQPKIEG